MTQKPLTLAQIVSLCGFLIIGTFYVTRIYSEFQDAKEERLLLDQKIDYVNDRLTKITGRNADKIDELEK